MMNKKTELKAKRRSDTYDVIMTTTDDITSSYTHAQEEELDTALGAVLSGTLYLITIVTISGNTILLIILLKTTALRTVTNCFIVSLAVSDLLTGIFVMPFCAAAIVTGSWPFAYGFCEAAGFIHNACSIATVLNIMMVCSDRAVAVARPLKYSFWLTPLSAGIMILYVWLQSIIFSVLPFLGFSHYTYGRAAGFCAFDWSSGSNVVLSYATFCLLTPAVVIFILVLVILKHARSRASLMSLMPAVPVAAVSVAVHSQPMVNYRRSTIQAMRTLFVITITVTALWTPQITVNIFDLRNSDVSENFRTSAMWLCLMSSMTNPLIFLSNKKFKQRFRDVFCKCFLKRSNTVGIEATQHTASTALPFTSGYEPSNVFSKGRPSQATIPENPEMYRKISFCEPQVKIGVKTELLLAVPGRNSKTVPVAKVEPVRKVSTETLRRLSHVSATETMRRLSHVSVTEPMRRLSNVSATETMRRLSHVSAIEPMRRPSDIRRSSEARRVHGGPVPEPGTHVQGTLDFESTQTTSESTSTDEHPPVILSVTPQLHAIPADLAEDANNDLV